jgi:hypothetical protein
MNEEAHLLAVERANQKARLGVLTSTRPAYPLTVLCKALVTGPPSLRHIIELLENSDAVYDFRELVREYLPEHEDFIMSQEDDEGRIREFVWYFDRRYFPLSDNIALNELTLGDFLREIPVDLMGFSYDDYHNFADFREGYILLLSLITSPYEKGDRVPILEKTRELVGAGLVELIPPEGWEPADLHRILDHTDYAGVADFADWVHSETGCMILDASRTDYDGEIWRRDLVDEITEQQTRVQELWAKIHDLCDRLEEDIHGRFRELLSVLLERKDLVIPKEQLPFPIDEDGQVVEQEENGENQVAGAHFRTAQQSPGKGPAER